ncbi:MAG TPA: hypothetical protein VGO78_05630 [Acidimicrobiales bacterium]|nr:hypothetical protein [Acidimicrobiales bacterium]
MTVTVASWISPRERKGTPSDIAGRGLFAVDDIAAGEVVAVHDVAAGTELTTDYALFESSDETLACGCGTPTCRGTVTGDDWRDPILQQRYAGWFSTYLADRIAAPGAGPAARTGGTQ